MPSFLLHFIIQKKIINLFVNNITLKLLVIIFIYLGKSTSGKSPSSELGYA